MKTEHIPNTESFNKVFSDESISDSIQEAFDFYHDNYTPKLTDEQKEEIKAKALSNPETKQIIINLIWEQTIDSAEADSQDHRDDIYCGYCDEVLKAIDLTELNLDND